MTPFRIPEDTLRDLTSRFSMAGIAKMYRTHPYKVISLAREYGIEVMPASEVQNREVATIREMAAAGHSMKVIADSIGRSQDFVARRSGSGLKAIAQWPKPDTDEWRALDGRKYEDVSEAVLEREWPLPNPIDGDAYARKKAQVANTYGCAARMCADA